MGVTGRHGRAEWEIVMDQKKRNQLSRRGLLAGAGALAIGGAGLASTVGAGSAVAAPGAGAPQPTAFGPVTVRAGDLRYENLVRGNNFRFVGRTNSTGGSSSGMVL